VIGEFEVTGSREYRGHAPGTVFPARLDRAAVSRAVKRGDIRLIREVEPTIQRDSLRLSDGWLEKGKE
jgi:hypothetical protein